MAQSEKYGIFPPYFLCTPVSLWQELDFFVIPER